MTDQLAAPSGPAAGQGPPAPPPPAPGRWAALVVLSLSLVVVTLDTSVLNIALPALARSLKATTADLQWITDAYTLLFAAALIPAGNLGMRFGARRALSGGLLVFVLGSVAAALSSSAIELVGWRALMGLGAAFVMPATLSLVVMLFPPQERAKAMGVWASAAGVGVLLGPIVGGALLDHFSWSSAFWVNVPLVLLALAAVFKLVPNVPGMRGGPLDLPALVLVTAGLALLVDGIIEAPDRGWLAATTLGELIAGVVLLAAFVVWELRQEHPMVDVRVFRQRAFSVASLALAVTFFALFGVLFALSPYLQLVHGYSPFKAGLGGIPFAVSMMASSVGSGGFAARVGVRGTLVSGLLLAAAGLSGLSLLGPHTAYVAVALSMAAVGTGMGAMMAPATVVIMSSVPPRYAAMASALNSTVRELGGVLGVAVVGSILSAGYRDRMKSLAGAPGSALKDLPGAHLTAARLPAEQAGPLVSAADRAFTSALTTGTAVAAVVLVVAAVLVASLMPRNVPTGPPPGAGGPPPGH
ncbi:EmrB/QacA subfamily drug resistance transporter [Kitasatospora sp. MAP12-15]|uniref:DHA2 family efflux MFS transporter permease subunit n=1 Tax=unclassified Kitasatospora TaxID=2633591 RepID=UPI002473A585|nr:DHA2 family efflux MFS transporter permease subunit [Kitasatospora sp. MAP12-44]MDH6111068.1 EmrB/QacA subfamily drug resistance transporter [Kitasatospora sp. MAP12-44]